MKSLERYKQNYSKMNIINEKILKPQKDSSGYMQVRLCKNGKTKLIFVHRLVAGAFMPDKTNFKSMPYEDRKNIKLDDLEINHKDENPNNNRVDNLEWCTHKYNCNYGNHSKKISNRTGFLVDQYDLQGNFIKRWNGVRTIERTLNISSSNISECCRGKRKTAGGYNWKYKDFKTTKGEIV